VIHLDNLSKSFGRAKALDGLTLAVAAGEKIALVGSNGAGKTTLFRCLLGEYNHEGEVRVDGRDPRRERTSVLRLVGFVPQLPPPLKMPVGDLVAFATGTSDADPRRVVGVAAELGLDVAEVSRRPFIKLSGGQKQKLLIAIALGRETRILILDEPAANLDPPARAVLFQLLAQRHDDTMIVSSHRVDEVAGLGTRIVELDRGRIVFDDRLILGDAAQQPMHVMLRIARPDGAFARAMQEWKFVATEGTRTSAGQTSAGQTSAGQTWVGVVAGPDRLRFLNLLARYAGLLSDVSLGHELEKDRSDEMACVCA